MGAGAQRADAGHRVAVTRQTPVAGAANTDCKKLPFPMSAPDGLLMQLNQATRRWHADADEPWLRLLRADVTRRDYVEQLVRMYGFEAPLESACAYTPQLSHVIEPRQLTRAGLIAQDLLALGLTPAEVAEIPQCSSISTFHDVGEALGWLYVVERTTLHHDQVRRHLAHRVPDTMSACNYLGMFERPGVEHWQRFGTMLDRFAGPPDDAGAVIEAADAAFACLVRWFQPLVLRLRSTG